MTEKKKKNPTWVEIKKCCPRCEEKKAISNHIQIMGSVIQALTQQLAKYRLSKECMMKEYLNRRIRFK